MKTSRVVLANSLIHCGHEVASASNRRDALRLSENLRFDVPVSDLGLPDGTGLDLVVEAKKRQPWKKTVALTAHGRSKEKELGFQAGFDEYLTKPFDFHQLRSLLADSPPGVGRSAPDLPRFSTRFCCLAPAIQLLGKQDVPMMPRHLLAVAAVDQRAAGRATIVVFRAALPVRGAG